MVDPGEAKRSPEPCRQCWSNTIWERVPESGDTPGTRPYALVWPGKVSGQHDGQNGVALDLTHIPHTQPHVSRGPGHTEHLGQG